MCRRMSLEERCYKKLKPVPMSTVKNFRKLLHLIECLHLHAKFQLLVLRCDKKNFRSFISSAAFKYLRILE